MQSAALEVVRVLAERGLPGIVVTDGAGTLQAVLPASHVVQFLVPCYVQDDPSLAGVLTESMVDRCAENLGGKTVRDALPEHLIDVPPVDGDDTIMEVAAIMARRRSPLVAVIKDGHLQGVITATRLLTAALPH